MRRDALIETCTARARDIVALQGLIPPAASKGGGKGKDKGEEDDDEKRKNAQKHQRPALPPGDEKKPKHRGRIQVQGGGVEKSRNWTQDVPRSRSQGQQDLAALKDELTKSQLRIREQAFEKAARFIDATTYTAPPDLHRTFRNDEVIARRGSERVDVEIHEGTAFV